MANKDFKVKNGIDIQTPLPVSMGGTGQTSTTNTLNSLLPTQSGNANKVLQTDGTNTTWYTIPTAYNRGNTASRPGSPTAGDLYFNTDYNYFEQYTALGWFPIAAAPGTPTGVTATNQGTGRAYNNGQMSVAFTPNTSAGYPSSFIVTPSPSTSPTTFTGTSSPVTVTGLASSTQYTYTVQATSAYGTSAASSASSGVTATTVPQAPSLTAVGATDTSATITITPGQNGGSTITQYTITSNPATTTQTTSNTSYTFTGLTTGITYTFTATATNANGTSAASLASNSVLIQTGSFEPIATTTVASGGTPYVEFTTIPQTYKILEIRMVCRSTSSGAGPASTAISLNGDTTTTNYFYGKQESLNTTSFTATQANSNNPALLNQNGLNSGMFTTQIYNIYEYSDSTKNKTISYYYGYDQGADTILDSRTGFGSIVWKNTPAINTIRLTPSSGSWAQNTQVTLYGIKG
jgi:hypothetical protein